MRIKRLDLKAFGPFTERVLEFDSKDPGLHIIFGPNEAGKSSSLRALKALLYGFPLRTSDNFQHANDQLMVGGRLVGADGQELEFYRRKKRKADVLGLDGNPLGSSSLVPFLHGIEPSLFESLFGIDHKTLVAGGEDILAQKGEIGQALFAAGTGIVSLKKILDSLEAEAGELFKVRGSTQQINLAIKEYNELKKFVKEESLPLSKWKVNQKRLKDAEVEHERLELESRQISAEAQRLDRLHKSIPELADLENLQKQQSELGDVVVLSPEFSKKLQLVEQESQEATLQISIKRDRLEKLQSKTDEISLNYTILDHAETIEDLHQRLGEYRKGQRDRPRLVGERTAYIKQAEVLIEEIGPELTIKDADSLQPVLSRKRNIQDLSSSYSVLSQKSIQVQEAKEEALAEIETTAEVLSQQPAARAIDGLEKAIKLAQRAGDMDRQIENIYREVINGNKNCHVELQRLKLWSGELDELLVLGLPLPETVRRFETDYSQLDNEKQQLKKDRKKADEELKTAITDNREVAYGGEVPTEQDLDESRQKRQIGWHLLRRQWIDCEDITKEADEYESGQAVHDAYEIHVERADLIADRLRREAERVAKTASLRARIESLEESIQEASQQEEKLAIRETGLGEKWQAEWKATKINPLAPGEMLAWLSDIDKLRFRVTEISNKEYEVSDLEKARKKHRSALIEELKDLGESQTFSGEELGNL